MSLRETFLLDKSDQPINPAKDESINKLMAPSEVKYNKIENVIGNIETAILDFTPSTNIILYNIYTTGNADGIFNLYINDNAVLTMRTSPVKRNVEKKFVNGLKILANENIKITVEHNESVSANFAATINYGEG